MVRKSVTSQIAKSGGRLRVGINKIQTGHTNQQEDSNMLNEQVNVILPEYDIKDLIKIYEINTYAKRCVDVIARNVTRGGFSITTDEGEVTSEKKKQIAEVYDKFMNMNPDMPFTRMLNDMIVDLKSTGSGALEVSRGLDGKPAGMYHVPIYSIAIEKVKEADNSFKNGQRFIQNYETYMGKSVRFVKYYAEEKQRNAENGYDIAINGDGKKTNEIIWLKLPNPKDRYYGLSPSVTLLKSYLITKYVEEYNVNEFEAGLLSKFAVLVKNGALTDESVDALTSYIQDMIDTKKWSSIPILNATGQGVDISIEKLGGDYNEGSYLALKKDTRQDVITAFGVPPMILSIVEDANRSNSVGQEQMFHEKEILPLQQELEYIFTRMIKYDLGYTDLNFVFNQPDFDDKTIMSDMADKGIKNGSYSINEAREMQGMDPIDDKGASERFIYHNTLGLINVKDLENWSSDQMVTAQGKASGDQVVQNLLGFKNKFINEKVREEISTGTDSKEFESNPYPEVE